MADEPTPTEQAASDDIEHIANQTPTPVEDEAAKWKALARKHEKEAKRLQGLEAEVEKVREASQSEQEKAIAAARKEAATAATAEATTKANRRILRAEIKAAAGTRLTDPADAVRLLDLDTFEVDDDGEVDSKAIGKALDALLVEKPYLAAKGGRPRGDVDQGVRTSGGPTDSRAADIAQIEADLKAGARRR